MYSSFGQNSRCSKGHHVFCLESGWLHERAATRDRFYVINLRRQASAKMEAMRRYPDAIAPDLVGTYPAQAKSGGGYVWDEVLEYRVWCHPERGAPDHEEGNDYYFAFATYAEAETYAERTPGSEKPLALIRQLEYIDEPAPGQYCHVQDERITEWCVEFLHRPRRTPNTIPQLLSPDAPKNRLDIIQGLANPKD